MRRSWRLAALAVPVALAAASAPLGAQPSPAAIPERPEQLRFAPSTFEPPPVEGLRFELRNGLPVFVVPDRDLPLVDVVLALPVGDRDEAPGEDGLASMTAAMARRGGAGGLGPEELDDAIDALGARIETSVSWTRAVLALDSGAAALDRGLELLASVALTPRFDEERLVQARENLRSSLVAETDDPRSVLNREWLRLVHGPEAARSRRLTAAAVAAFDRGALVRFHQRRWRPDGAVLAVSGDVDAEAVAARLDELFGGWGEARAAAADTATGGSRDAGSPDAAEAGERLAAPERPGRRRAAEAGGAGADFDARATPAAASPGWWTVHRRGAQAAVALGHRGAVFGAWDDRDRWALVLMTEILDGPGAVSRLRARLQLEEGLAYRVLTYFNLDVTPPSSAAHPAPPRSTGEFRVFFETAPESAATAAAAVLDELERLQKHQAPETELATARQSLLARLPLFFDRAETIAGRYAEDELLGRPHDHWRRYRQRLQAVTPADVRRAARRTIDLEGIALLVVGDETAVTSGVGAKELIRILGPPRPLPTSSSTDRSVR